jgi:guanylate kinase
MTKIILVAAPSGAGKSSFVDRVTFDLPQALTDIVTCTTRPPRQGDVPGKTYHFLSMQEFELRKQQGLFVEWAQVHSNYYGILASSLESAWSNHRCAIMDVDVQGTKTIKTLYPSETKTLFIMPPSIDELRRRIEKRDGGRPKDLEARMQTAEREIALASQFDACLVNDDFDRSYGLFKKIIEDWLRAS